MKVLLILMLVTANGPSQEPYEMPSLEACIAKLKTGLSGVATKTSEMRKAGVVAFGAACVVELAKEQESKS